MRGFKTKYERQSAAITTVIGVIILFLLFFFVTLDPDDIPVEYGMEVNFGTTDFGSGRRQPKQKIRQAPTPKVSEPEKAEEIKPQEEVKPSEPAKTAETTKAENVLTQQQEEAIAIKKAEEAKKLAEAAERKAKADAERKEREEAERKEQARQAAIAKAKAEQDAKKKKLDALLGGVTNSDGTDSGSEGDDNRAGDKGKETGDPNASGYYGKAGNGRGGNYQLGGRAPLSKPKPEYICNEEGVVVVQISVNRSGKVISATPGARGTTNSASCLLDKAKAAALKTRWESDSNAPDKQVGKIVYNFKLTE